MKILSLDQSTRLTGVSVIDNDDLIHYELLDTSEISTMLERFICIKSEIIHRIEIWKPDVVVLEDVQSQINKQTFKDLSKLLGVLELSLEEHRWSDRIKYYDLYIKSVNQWRSILKFPRMKRAEAKKYAINYVKDKYGITPQEDIAESICMGIAVKKELEELYK